MFENVLGQSAAAQLAADIQQGILAPAVLFSGPHASGKGTAALELGRVISCEALAADAPPAAKAHWHCNCPSCARHRLLIHPDLLCLGSRAFSAEIAASAGAFLRDPENPSSRLLFIRAIRKLLARFNPVLWEDEPKKGKVAIAPLVNGMEEEIDEFDALLKSSAGSGDKGASENSKLLKLVESMKKNAFKLESEGLSTTIPIDRIRRASYWGRLAPSGNGKLIIIENADRMQEEARNSLLKLLEEPPARLTLALTTTRPSSLLPTVLSRLRLYRFHAREPDVQTTVIRRIFRDNKESGISSYLDSFLPVSGDSLDSLAAFFAASIAFKAAVLCKKQKRPIAAEVILLGKYATAKAEAAGLGRPQGETAAAVTLVLSKAERFEVRSLFSRFLRNLLENVSASQRQSETIFERTSDGENFSFLPSVAYNEVWKKSTSWGETAVSSYRLSPGLVLEKLFTDLSLSMAAL